MCVFCTYWGGSGVPVLYSHLKLELGGREKQRERKKEERERERKKKEREISILHTILAGICTYLGEEIHEEVTKSTERSKHSVHLGLRQTPFPTEKRKHHNLHIPNKL